MTLAISLGIFAWIVWVVAWIVNAVIIHESRLRGRYSTRRF